MIPGDTPTPTAVGFRLLLGLLDKDPERAGAAYVRLRAALIKFFDWRGAHWPEECADETLDRIVRKLGAGVVVKDVAGFAHGIARHVLQEALRSDACFVARGIDGIDIAAPAPASTDRLAGHLEACLEALPEAGRDLVLAYYAHDGGRGRIQERRRMARSLGLSDNALRSRVQRLKDRLEECVRLKTSATTGSQQAAPGSDRHNSSGEDTKT